ncbi:MAG TPA: hypothetical protein VF941_22915 [Clostridia bacterium]
MKFIGKETKYSIELTQSDVDQIENLLIEAAGRTGDQAITALKDAFISQIPK